MNNKIYGAMVGLMISLILLTLCLVFYYTTITRTLFGSDPSLMFKLFIVLYGWPFMVLAFILNLVGLDIFNPLMLIVVSSGTYAALGMYFYGQNKSASSGQKESRIRSKQKNI